jgi:hypothetical protein
MIGARREATTTRMTLRVAIALRGIRIALRAGSTHRVRARGCASADHALMAVKPYRSDGNTQERSDRKTPPKSLRARQAAFSVARPLIEVAKSEHPNRAD